MAICERAAASVEYMHRKLSELKRFRNIRKVKMSIVAVRKCSIRVPKRTRDEIRRIWHSFYNVLREEIVYTCMSLVRDENPSSTARRAL